VLKNKGNSIVDLLDGSFVAGGSQISDLYGLAIIPTGKDDRRLLQNELRWMVDEWIDSGISNELIEGKDGSVKRLVEECRLKRRLKLNTRLRDEVISFLQRRKSWTQLSSDGSSLESKYMFELDDSPRDIALNFFIDFFKSEERFRLMRCESCRKIMLPPKPRDVYQVGWFCESHTAERKKATVEKSREDRHAKILLYGARALLSYKPRDGNKPRFICKEVNSRLDFYERIKPNTISRHMKLIEDIAHDMSSAGTSADQIENRRLELDQSGAFDKVLIGGTEDPLLFIVEKGRKQNAKG
jgi:hypothetical protein